MKKVLSVVLLISMLLGMWIMPAAAAEGDTATDAGEVLYYVDGQCRPSWIGSFCNNQYTVAEDGSYFTTDAFLPAQFGQAVTIDEVVQLSISLRVTDTTRAAADYIALWHNAVDGSVQFRYYPMQKMLALYIGDTIVGEPKEVADWATGAEATFHVLTMDMAEDGKTVCYADGEKVFETTLSSPAWTGKMPIVWNSGKKPFDIAYYAITTPGYDLTNLPAYASALNRDLAYYVDVNSPKWVIDKFASGAEFVTMYPEDNCFAFTSGYPAPFSQQMKCAAPLIIEYEISGSNFEKAGDWIGLWCTQGSVYTYRYYPVDKKLALHDPDGNEVASHTVDWSGAATEFHKLAIILQADGTLLCYADGEKIFTHKIADFSLEANTGIIPILQKSGGKYVMVRSFAVYEMSNVVDIPEYYFNMDDKMEVSDNLLDKFMGGGNKGTDYDRNEDGTFYLAKTRIAPGPATEDAGQMKVNSKDFVFATSMKMIGSYTEDSRRGLWIPSKGAGNKILQYNPGKKTVTFGPDGGEPEFTMDVDWETGLEKAEWHDFAVAVSIDDANKATIKCYVDRKLVHTATYENFTDATDGEGFQPLMMGGNCEHFMKYCVVANGTYDPTKPQNLLHSAAHELTRDILILKEATCAGEGTKGEKIVACAECDVFEIQEYTAEHIASDWIVDTAATCTAKGSQHKECTVCGETLETEEIAMLDHTPSDWIVDKEATEEEEGSQHKECTVCKEVLETEAIPKLDPQKPPFTDVAEDAWYYEYVAYVYRNNLFLGTSDTTFEPDTTMTRAMFVRLLANYEGVDFTQYEDAELPFTDVDMDEWYGTAVAWAYENEVVLGTSETTFNPGDEITREQMCLMLVNYMNYKEITLTVSDEEISFTDADQIADWAKEAVEFCAAAGIVKGPGDGSFNPKGIASRAEVATLITNFCNALADQPAE